MCEASCLDTASITGMEGGRGDCSAGSGGGNGGDSELLFLGCLDIRFTDPVVREFGVRMLDRLSDVRFAEVLPQLTQALKYELYHDSPLSRCLFRRSLLAPLRIGHPFFWLLR